MGACFHGFISFWLLGCCNIHFWRTPLRFSSFQYAAALNISDRYKLAPFHEFIFETEHSSGDGGCIAVGSVDGKKVSVLPRRHFLSFSMYGQRVASTLRLPLLCLHQ